MTTYWLFQATISFVFSTYLISTQIFPSPWTALASLASAMVFHRPLGETRFRNFAQLSTLALVHCLYANLDKNWLITSTLILNAIPFLTYQILCSFLKYPPHEPLEVAREARMPAWCYVFLAFTYLFSIQSLYQYWDNERRLAIHQIYVGFMMLLETFYCLSAHRDIDRRRRLREAEIAEIARDLRAFAGLCHRPMD